MLDHFCLLDDARRSAGIIHAVPELAGCLLELSGTLVASRVWATGQILAKLDAYPGLAGLPLHGKMVQTLCGVMQDLMVGDP